MNIPIAKTLADSGPIATLRLTFKRDPRKSLLLTVLLAILAVLGGRAMMGGHTLSGADAEHLNPAGGLDGSGAGVQDSHKLTVQKSLAQWAKLPDESIKRNLFAVPFEFFPQDPAHQTTAAHSDVTPARTGQSQDELIKQHQILVDNLRAEAANLTLEGTLMGAHPRAWINGVLVGLGELVPKTEFRVTQVEPRRIIIEERSVQIELSMK